jgi:UDP-N-acetylglucosamine--N-acetylmuramyl-(pentapeptide) pyrophosphoryl-undecaprenol N-acetylglucosamine transferase
MTEHRILMTGGGTAGSIAPLLAVADECRVRMKDATIKFLVTKNAKEADLIRTAGYRFQPFPAGKFRRYWHWKNITDIFRTLYAFWRALFLMLHQRPCVVVSAGSYISVPVVWAAWVLRIPVVCHQQDVIVGLANRLMMPFARVITVTFEETKAKLPKNKDVRVTGNPVRKEITTQTQGEARSYLRVQSAKPVICILGGSSGAQYLNSLITRVAPRLTPICAIVHVTGTHGAQTTLSLQDYHPISFLAGGIAQALAAADVVVTRAGLSTMSEIAAAGKAAIVIPMPQTHQEANANLFHSHHAVIRLDQTTLTDEAFIHHVSSLLAHPVERERLSRAIAEFSRPDAARDLADILHTLMSHHEHVS